MADLTPPDCRIYVDSDYSETELMGLLMQILLDAPDKSAPRCEATVARNGDYDIARRRKFPDGFIYFRYVIDLYMDADLPLNERARLTATLLNHLWDERFPAIAACSYEKRLPLGGGYQNRSVPWPR
jgi:hypothetical protein